MLDPRLVENRFQEVLESLSFPSSERVQLLRMVEFFEVLLETRSSDLIVEYSPILISRLSQIVNAIEFTQENVAISDRLTPILWSLVLDYDRIGNTAVCLSMLHRLSEARTRVELSS